MRGVILAGGTASRMWPLTKATNKHLLPIGNKPMIYYPINCLREAGIEEILIVTGTDHMGHMVNCLGSGNEFGCSFTYKVQDQPGGIAQALGLAEGFVGDDNVTVILGDNIFDDTDTLTCTIDEFDSTNTESSSYCMLFAKEVNDPERFGVIQVDEFGRPIGIEEKPDKPKSNLAVTGVYIYTPNVFDIIRTIKPSDRGEMEITDVNNMYIKKHEAHVEILYNFWSDAGTFESYHKANEYMQTRSM